MNVDASEIHEQMAVVDRDGQQVAVVEAVEGDFLKLIPEGAAEPHWLDFFSVESVDERVHLNLTAKELESEWTDTDPFEGGDVSAGY